MGSPPSVMSRLALFGYAAPSEPLQGRSTSLGTGGTPIATAVPAYASISTACRTHDGTPVASNATSTPSPPVRSRTAVTASTVEASITSVAPSAVAHPSFAGATSIAIRRSAPAIFAPCIADRPMPPRPITATEAPGHTFAVRIAAPTPVDTPHPSRHARSSGMPSGSGIACAAWTTVRVARVPQARTPASGAPSRARRSRGAWTHAWEQRLGIPRMHDRQVPHGTAHDRTTRSPGRTLSTPSPTCSMMPAPS